MGIFILILLVLGVGIWLGFVIGFSRAMREASAQMQQSKRPVIAWILIAGACICLVIAAGASLYSWHFVSTAARANGTVTELRGHTDKKDGSTRYAPTFTFRDAAGAEHTVFSTAYSSPPQHSVGDSVPVLYQPTDPQSARIDDSLYLWGLPTAAGLLGGLYLPIGFVILFWPRIVARFRRQTV